jgi:hypothetical protein
MRPMIQKELDSLTKTELKEFAWLIGLLIGVKNNTDLSGSQAWKEVKEAYKLLKKRDISNGK